jgi:hypothetical protein
MNTDKNKAQPPKGGKPELAFLVKVGGIEGEPRAYEFDRERIVVGRGQDVDLQVAHSAMSRHQFAIERIVQNEGPPRFRIVPLGGRNPTYLNGQPAVEGSLTPGDQIAVGPMRLSIERPRRKPASAGSRRTLVVGVAALAVMLALLLTGQEAPKKKQAPSAAADIGAPLFHALPALECATVDACAARARERYAKGRQYEDLAANDSGNWYRAAVEFAYAAQLRNAAGTALPEIADASERVDRSARKAQQLLDDARFQLQTAAKNKNGLAALEALATIEQVVPEPTHPIRAGVEETKREMLKKKEKKK